MRRGVCDVYTAMSVYFAIYDIYRFIVSTPIIECIIIIITVYS